MSLRYDNQQTRSWTHQWISRGLAMPDEANRSTQTVIQELYQRQTNLALASETFIPASKSVKGPIWQRFGWGLTLSDQVLP